MKTTRVNTIRLTQFKKNILFLGLAAHLLVACSTSVPTSTPFPILQEPVLEKTEDLVREWVREHSKDIAEDLFREMDKHDLGEKMSGSTGLTRRVAEALSVEAITRTPEGVAATISWELDVGNEHGTILYGTLPVVMKMYQDRVNAEPDYEGARLCVQDAAEGWTKVRCSDK